MCANREMAQIIMGTLRQDLTLIKPWEIDKVGELFLNDTAVIFIVALGERSHKVKKIFQLKSAYSRLYIVIIVDNLMYDFARLCGKKGIDRVFHIKELDALERSITNSKMMSLSIKLHDVGIKLDGLSNTAEKALRLIEKDYVGLKSVKEISNYLNLHESTLIREFRKYDLLSPKQLLMHFKIFHSLKLIGMSSFTIKEIAYSSGFTNEKRFIECFVRVMNVTPGKYQLDRELLLKSRISQ